MSTPAETFENLIKRNESDTLDFKLCNYAFDADSKEERKRKRAKFIKDIISMANTPRDESAYIVLGVRSYPDGRKELVGLDTHIDDAEFQGKFSSMCHPHPIFRFEPVPQEGKTFAFIEIPADRSIGPFLPIEEVGNVLRKHSVYHRRNSQNASADVSEQRKIYEWFRGSRILRPPGDCVDPKWEEFIQAVHRFDSNRKYILVTSPGITGQGGPAENISNVPWLLVADFDHKSSTSGLLARAEMALNKRVSLHRVTLDTRIAINPVGATYWYFTRGIEGRESTLNTGSWIQWQRMYAKEIQERLSRFAKVTNSPVTVVVLWTELSLNRHLDSFLGAIVASFGESVEIVIVCPTGTEYDSLADQYTAYYLEIPIPQLFHGLGSLQPNSRDISQIVFPSSSGADIVLDEQTVTWLKEEMILVHKNAGLHYDKEDVTHSTFLRGREISWFELGLHLDVDRDIADKMRKAIRRDLKNRVSTRINLYHAPGAGGTTLARRLLWDFRNEFPAIVLNRSQPSETVERIQKIFAETAQSVLIKIDGSRISDRQSDELHKLLSASNIPFVMLQVLRRFDPPKTSQRAFFLDQKLSPPESIRFAGALTREMPSKKKAIETAAMSQHRSAFYLGLVAFERDFFTIERYVAAHLIGLNEIQRRILVYLAIAHYYGQQSIQEQSFAEILEILPNRSVNLTKALPVSALTLLICPERRRWRTIHHLVSEELIQQVLSTPTSDKRIWRNRLSDWATEFADFCDRSLPEPSEESMELLRRVFIYREESELLGSEGAAGKYYSRIITDIPISQGKERVLRHLTELFPYEAHFWAHLSRFNAHELKDYDKAIEIADRALELAPGDHMLHHMKGMVCRSQAYEIMQQNLPLDVVLEKAKMASSAFAEARKLEPDDEYGFISEAQLIIRVIDYAGKVAKKNPVSAAADHNDPWIRDGFQAVEDLLMQVREKRRDSAADSEYEQRCQAKLTFLYGEHENALQIWDNLLSRKGNIYAPPIRRQIVWTLLSRRERDWGNLQPKEINRSVGLLEENIKEDPNDERNIRLWIQAIRYQAAPPSVETVVERVAYWVSNTDTLEANYYLYVLYMLLAFKGSTVAVDQAIRILERCREKSRYRRDKTRSYEWLGKASELKQLVHRDRLGGWNPEKRFWQNTSPLVRVKGVISKINGPQAGAIELPIGVTAFFVPGVSGHSAGRSENTSVTFFLGFSYDGLRAWSVQDV